MVNGVFIAQNAERLVGTAFRHQGRSMARGLDCSGVIVLAHQMSGLRVDDYTRYSCPPKPRDLLDGLRRNAVRIAGPCIGAVLLFRAPKGKRAAQHTGIDVGDGWMVHSEIGKGVVRERWRGTAHEDRLLGVYGHKGVAW